MKAIPVIDIFAGAGGLSEGFGGYSSDDLRYDVRLSIEKEPFACDTLRLRAFFRLFRESRVPELYYDAIRGDRYAMERIQATAAWKDAADHVRKWTLGETSPGTIHTEIKRRIGNRRDWVLLGGPPCQAYSVIGRARLTGAGSRISDNKLREERQKELEEQFAADHRHTLYRQYLQIVAVHQPAVFVMENVKGLLSARLHVGRHRCGDMKYEPVLDHIMADLRDPWRALQKDPSIRQLRTLAVNPSGRKYRLLSFVAPAGAGGEATDPMEFLIECEKYGIPQMRHRVIILGIREDIDPAGFQCLQKWKGSVPVKVLLKGLPKIRSTLSADTDTRQKYGYDSSESWRRALKESFPRAALPEIPVKPRELIRKTLSANEIPPQGGAFIEAAVDPAAAPLQLRTWLNDDRIGGAIQHEARSHMASDLGRYLYSSAMGAATGLSPKIDDWPRALLPAHKNVRVNGRKTQTIVDGFNDRFRVQVWNKPATTITSHISKDGHSTIHPDPMQCRSLTVREAARLQTFPDNFYFFGARTEQYQQIGNAVPPFLALQLAGVVAQLFSADKTGRRASRKVGKTQKKNASKGKARTAQRGRRKAR